MIHYKRVRFKQPESFTRDHGTLIEEKDGYAIFYSVVAHVVAVHDTKNNRMRIYGFGSDDSPVHSLDPYDDQIQDLLKELMGSGPSVEQVRRPPGRPPLNPVPTSAA